MRDACSTIFLSPYFGLSDSVVFLCFFLLLFYFVCLFFFFCFFFFVFFLNFNAPVLASVNVIHAISALTIVLVGILNICDAVWP